MASSIAMAPLNTIAKASRGLKEATWDRGAAQIGSGRAIVATRIEQTRAQAREKLSSFPSPRVLQDQVREITFDNVRAVGLGFISRTEAMIDNILGPGVANRTIRNGSEDEVEDDSGEGVVNRVPRFLAIQVLRTFGVQLTGSATLRVTVLCMADTCSAVLRQLRFADKRQLLRRLHLQEVQTLASNVGGHSALVARATRMHPYLGWALRMLGDRLAVRVFGNAAAQVGVEVGTEVATEAGVRILTAAALEEAGLHMEEVEDDYRARMQRERILDGEDDEMFSEPRHDTTRGIVTEFQLIVKNSFIEFADDEPALGLCHSRRTWSLPDLSQFSQVREDLEFAGTSEPFTLMLNCLDSANELSPKGSVGAGASILGEQTTSTATGCQSGTGSDRGMYQDSMEHQAQQQLSQQKQKQDLTSDQQKQPAWVVASSSLAGGAPPSPSLQPGVPSMVPCEGLSCLPLKVSSAPAVVQTSLRTPASSSRAPAPPLSASSDPAKVVTSLTAATAATSLGQATMEASGEESSEVPPHLRTTVMLRCLPTEYSRQMLLDLLDNLGFNGKYDFVYLPVDFTRGVPLGYALVSCCEPASAQEMLQVVNGFNTWAVPSDNVCTASWSEPHQGVEAHVERYRNSPVMHQSVPDHYKPVVFDAGNRISFPPATKTIRAPRIRHLKQT